jgi:pectin methylesterase-like acyl-CoA thioesterase
MTHIKLVLHSLAALVLGGALVAQAIPGSPQRIRPATTRVLVVDANPANCRFAGTIQAAVDAATSATSRPRA